MPVRLSHVYLVRLWSKTSSSKEARLAKFIVIAHTPGESVTLRWARL